jgi:ribonucleoside-diphosphate reductase alpha chain
MSFLEVFDRAAGATKSGGTTRRAAKMVCLDMDHPEIKDFITWKIREEKKAQALIAAGYSSDFNGEAYHTISGQNSNNSVRVTDDFMHAVERGAPWQTIARTTGEVIDTYQARDLWNLVAEAAWGCADPGVQYDTTINKWHTVPNTGRINASNPCSEYLHLDDSACNLASLNLTKFLRSDGSFDVEAYRHAIRVFFVAQEILVDFASYPTKQIAQNSHDYRPLGLGYANLGSLLMVLGIPYDSDKGRAWAGALTAILCGHAYRVSAEMAAAKGAFPGFAKNREPMLKVMKMHREAAYNLHRDLCPEPLWRTSRDDWDQAVALGTQFGYRNAQATVLAPTGCLVGGSLVATDRGLVRLRTLGDTEGAKWQDISLKVATDEGAKDATKFYINGRERVVTIDTGRGYRIEGTPTHRIKVVDPVSGEWIWKRFAEIEEGDLVPLALNQIVGNPQHVPLPPLPEAYWTSDHTSRVPREMNPDLAEFIGYFMGDGSLHAKGLRLCVSEQDSDVAERLVTLSKKLFNLEAHCSAKQGYTEVALHSVRLTLWWEACGFAKHEPSPDHQGKGYLPYIPDAVLASNDRAVYGAFLRGLFEADGTVHSAGYPSWSTTSLEFSYEVQQLLLAMGIPTARKMDTTGWRQPALAVLRVLNLSFNEAFLKDIGFMSARKRDAVKVTDLAQASRHDHIPGHPGAHRSPHDEGRAAPPRAARPARSHRRDLPADRPGTPDIGAGRGAR